MSDQINPGGDEMTDEEREAAQLSARKMLGEGEAVDLVTAGLFFSGRQARNVFYMNVAAHGDPPEHAQCPAQPRNPAGGPDSG